MTEFIDIRSTASSRGLGAAISGSRVTARKAAGLPGVRFHDLRHTVASWLLQDGRSLKAVQKVLGHEDIGTTARYAHLEQEQFAEAMAGALGGRSRKTARRGSSG